VQGFQRGTRVMAFVPSGGYADHAALDTANVYIVPDDLDFGAATGLLVQGLTAYFLLETGQLSPGQIVLVPGAAGGVGSLAVQIARLKGAGKVLGLASPSKHDFVKSLGADAVFDYTQPGWAKDVLAETDGAGVNVFLDSQGELETEAFDTLAAKSHWLVYGAQAGSSSVLTTERLRLMQGKNMTLRGYSLYANVAEWARGVQEMLGWVSEKKLKIDVTRFPLAEAAKAHEAISARQTMGKVVLEP
jgi:NADPH2:quinone reductase